MTKNIKIKSYIIILFIFIIIVNTHKITISEENNDYIYSNDNNWKYLEKSLLSNKIYEYPPHLYFKFFKNNKVYTIYYYYTVKKVIRKIFMGFWNINYKEKYISLKIKDAIDRYFINDKYYSFKIYIDKKTELLNDVIILYKKKKFEEPEDEDLRYYSSDDYLVLAVAQEIPEEKDKNFLHKIE